MRVLNLTKSNVVAAAVAVFLIFSLVFPLTHPALAAQDLNLFTSPLPISLSMDPGSSSTTDIKIKNGSPATEKLKVSLMKFGAYGEEGKPSLADRGPGDDYFDWVSFSPSTFDAPYNQWVDVKMTINAPKSAALGYYYAVVFSRADAPKPTKQGNVLVGSTAVLVLLDVKSPNAKRSLQLSSFKLDKRSYEFLPATFSVRVHNSGNIHLVPHGNIFISRGGHQVASLVVNTQQGNVLPGTNRVYTTSWDDGFPVYLPKQNAGKTEIGKDGQPVKQLSWDLSKLPKLRFGHYTAHLTLAYDNGTRDVPIDATISFWVVPWRIIIGIILIGGLAAIGLWSTGRNIYRRIRKS